MTAAIDPTAGQRALAAKLLADPVMPPANRPIPVSAYTSEDRFDTEMKQMFRKLPVPIAASAQLRPGEAMAHDLTGVPLILTRDKAGAAHAFLNMCRHRGTRILDATEPAKAPKLVCPYHAWSYALNGDLSGVPRAESFAGFCKRDFGLAAFPAHEAGGMIWVALDRDATPDFAGFIGALAGDLDRIGLAGHHVYARRSHKVAANWKLVIDAFQESYHVTRLHRATIGPFFADGIAVYDRIGPHFRNALIRSDGGTPPGDADLATLRRSITFSYSLLPATVIIVSPDYVNLLLMHPQSRSETIVENVMLIPEPPADAKAEAHWAKSFELIDQGVLADEDFKAAERAQSGLRAGGLENLTLGGMETGVADFHAAIDQLLETPA